MKRFVFKVAAFLSLQFLVLIALWSGWRNESHYLRGGILKESLTTDTPGPRVLFVGGSNVAFGIRSEFLESIFHRPVINLGLHAGLAKDFILNQAASAVKEGDIVVVVLEYEHYYGYLPSLDLLTMACLDPSELQHYSLRDWAYLGDQGLCLLSALANAGLNGWSTGAELSSGMMKLDAFNSRADFVHAEKSKFHSTTNDYPPLTFPGLEEIISELNQLNERCVSKGAILYLGYPPMPKEVIARGEDRLVWLDRTLRERLRFDVLWHPADMAQDDSAFFDSRYHLTKTGAEENSRRVLHAMSGKVNPEEAEHLSRLARGSDASSVK